LGYSEENPLKAEFVKLSHHGSKGNTNAELLGIIDSKVFVVSSNGSIHKLPDKQCLSRIIHRGPDARIHFNYGEMISNIFSQQDHDDFPLFKAETIANPIEI